MAGKHSSNAPLLSKEASRRDVQVERHPRQLAMQSRIGGSRASVESDIGDEDGARPSAGLSYRTRGLIA